MILLADDNHELRVALAELLRRQGQTVLEAENGSVALELAGRHRDQLEALITDFDMPFLDGLSLIEKIRRRQPDLRILLITSRLPAEMPASTAVEVLMKPFELSQVSGWLRSEGRVSAGVVSTGTASMGAGQGSFLPRPTKDTHPRRASGVAITVISAVALCAALLGLRTSFGDWADRSRALPGPPVEDRLRSAAVEGLKPLGVMAEPPGRFTWDPIHGAESYRLRVTDIVDQEIWRIETHEPVAQLPADVRSGWLPHVAFYVTIEAFGADREALASTSGGRLRVVPSEPRVDGQEEPES